MRGSFVVLKKPMKKWEAPHENEILTEDKIKNL